MGKPLILTMPKKEAHKMQSTAAIFCYGAAAAYIGGGFVVPARSAPGDR